MCSFDQLRCADGQCLNINKRCDGISDCINGQDEVGCGTLFSQWLITSSKT